MSCCCIHLLPAADPAAATVRGAGSKAAVAPGAAAAQDSVQRQRKTGGQRFLLQPWFLVCLYRAAGCRPVHRSTCFPDRVLLLPHSCSKRLHATLAWWWWRREASRQHCTRPQQTHGTLRLPLQNICVTVHVWLRLLATSAAAFAAVAVNGEGAVHLCDVLACKLPAERWWENNGGGKGSNSSKGLPRSGSRGRGFRQESALIAEAAYADIEEYGE
jgi:hypothetical protein